jgi:hypothetical protein
MDFCEKCGVPAMVAKLKMAASQGKSVGVEKSLAQDSEMAKSKILEKFPPKPEEVKAENPDEKSFYQKWWFWTLVLALGGAAAAGGKSSAPTGTASGSGTSTAPLTVHW